MSNEELVSRVVAGSRGKMDEIRENIDAALDQGTVRGKNGAPGPPRKWLPDLSKSWPVEIWQENREVFKALVVHPIIFVLIIEALSLVSYIIEHSSFAQERKTVLETVDFYIILVVLVIFGGDFIMKLLIHLWRGNGHRGDQK
jgi:hypothetical protein